MIRTNAFTNIRPTKINFYLRFMAAKGCSSEDVLAGTNITNEVLKSRKAVVEVPDYISVVKNMMRLTQSPTLAFDLGNYLIPADLGILGHAVSACANVEEAGIIWEKYNPLFLGNLIAVDEYLNEDPKWYEFRPRIPLSPYLLQYFMEENVSIETALFRKFNQYESGDSFFSFTYPAPPYAQLYEKNLHAKVKFGAKKNLYVPNTKDKNYFKPFPSADSETLEVLVHYLEKESAIYFSQGSLIDKVRIIIEEELPVILHIDDVAMKFNCSGRTLSRNLKNEGKTYKQIIEDVRLKLAKNYLATTSLTILEIANLLGFADGSSLSRSIKTLTGKKITDLRKK